MEFSRHVVNFILSSREERKVSKENLKKFLERHIIEK